ncbi:MAG: L,D-transpeptidase [Rhizobiaceae bacterium]|nr:L,D-transpeptidase [Rhizobiaceae bacterium]
MFPRSLILLGLCAVLGMGTPSFAETVKPQKSTMTSGKTKAAESGSTKNKKKIAAKKSGKQDEDPKDAAAKAKAKAEEKAARAQKILDAKKLAMREKAKADAEARRQAWAEKFSGKATETAEAEPEKARPVKVKAEKAAVAAGVGLTAERLKAQEAAAVGAEVVMRQGNNGELRSADVAQPSSGFFQVLFGDEPAQQSMLPETRALDGVLEKKKKFQVRPEFEPQTVSFSGYPRGTIVIDTDAHFLYLVESSSSARRYGIAVGRDGLQYKGKVAVGDKQEWPRWIPTLDMQKREPKKYGQYKDGMPGGGQNPLGARAIYLYEGKQDTHLRIHGTIAPQTIGTNSSNGCFRMVNEHVIDLYKRVRVGTPVVVL